MSKQSTKPITPPHMVSDQRSFLCFPSLPRAPNWPRVLSQFGVLCGQVQTLYDDLLLEERSWSSRLHSSQTLIQPLSHLFNPSTALRTKSTQEAETFELDAFQQFLQDQELKDYSAIELRDQLNDFNAAVLKLSRWVAQASSLPLPKDPPTTILPSTSTSTPGTSNPPIPLPVRSKADTDRIEELILQQTMASMMTGRQTRQQ